MIEAFLHEINKQIASNIELFKQTKLEIFKQRIESLEAKKREIMKSIYCQNQNLI
ncbi:MAG: hypothetical protein ACFE9Z_08130 [Promethearchaeota archaeon]